MAGGRDVRGGAEGSSPGKTPHAVAVAMGARWVGVVGVAASRLRHRPPSAVRRGIRPGTVGHLPGGPTLWHRSWLRHRPWPPLLLWLLLRCELTQLEYVCPPLGPHPGGPLTPRPPPLTSSGTSAMVSNTASMG